MYSALTSTQFAAVLEIQVADIQIHTHTDRLRYAFSTCAPRNNYLAVLLAHYKSGFTINYDAGSQHSVANVKVTLELTHQC